MTGRVWSRPSRRLLPRSAAAVGIALWAASPVAAQEFEGVLTMRQTRFTAPTVATLHADEQIAFLQQPVELLRAAAPADSSVQEVGVQYYLKGGRLRSSPPSEPGAGPEYLVMDLVTGVYRIVQPAQRIVLEWTRREAAPGAPEEPTRIRGAPEPFADRVVNGFGCTGYVTDNADGTLEVTWVTGDVPELTEAFAHLGVLSRSLGAAESGERPIDRLLARGFPVLTVTFDRADGTLTIAEVDEVERRPLEDELFEIPAGFMTVSVQP